MLNFVRLTIVMAISIVADLANKVVDHTLVTIVESFFDSVFLFVLLVVLFSLAVRKSKGLWSRPQGQAQNGWNYPAVAEMPNTQGGAVPVPMAYQGPGTQSLTPELAGIQKPVPELAVTQKPIPELVGTQTPISELPAYLQVAHQQQQQQLLQQQQQQQQYGQQVAPVQGQYYYYPQQTYQQPMPPHQQE